MRTNTSLSLAFLGVLILNTTIGRAADLVWIGGTGAWNSAGNWSPAQVPTAADNAWITNSGTYTVTVPAGTIANCASFDIGGAAGTQELAIDRATLTFNATSLINPNGRLTFLVAQSVVTGPGNLTVDGMIDWANGTMSGTGTTSIGTGGVLAIGSGGVTLGRSLINGGTATWAGGNLTISAGNTFNNLVGATFDITRDGHLVGASTTVINNSGLFRLTAGTTGSIITAPFNNSGNLQVLVTTLSLNLGGSHTGTMSSAVGATINFGGGNHVLAAGSLVAGGSIVSLSGAATLSVSGTFGAGSTLNLISGVATLTATCDVTAATLGINGANCIVNYDSSGSVLAVNLSQGTLGGTSPVTVTGPLTLSGGSITNPFVTADGGIAISGNTTLNGTKLVNPGTAIWSAGNLTGANGAVISNLVGATFINTFDGNAANGAGAPPLFINAGLLQKTNGTAALGTTAIDFQFINTGTVEVQTNTLRYVINQQTSGVTLLDGGGLAAQSQPIQLLGGSLVGTGLVTVANTMNVVNSSSISPGLPLGELDISGNYQQTASGVLNIDLGGYLPGTTYDLITVTAGGAGGIATLGGTLNVSLANGFSPTNGASFTFLTAASRVGSFATFNYPSNDIGMQVNYDLTSAKVTVSNLKPVVANPIISPASVSYGSAFNFQFPANTFTDPDGDTLTYTASGMPPGISFTPSTRTFSGTPTQAGIFPVTVAANDGGTPNLKATNTFNITINPATLTIVANSQTKPFGAVDPLLAFNVSGLQFSDTQTSVLTGALTRAAGETVAGSPYAITQGTLAANGNYVISFTGNALTITPATLTIAAQANTKTYGASDPALSFTVSGLQFSDTQASVLTGALTRAAGETVAGSPYAITQGTLAANGNYAISFTGNALTITPATLTIAAQAKTKTYGASDPALTFTASGLEFSDTQASVLTGALTRAAGETVAGSPYAITQGTLAANGNYAISFTGASLLITPASLAVIADQKTKVYGAADPALSFTVSGLQFSDTQASVLTGALTRAAGETVAGSPYAITQGTLAANGNYAIGFTGANLLITPASLAIIADQKTKVYGAADPALSFTVSGLQFTDTQASVLTGALTRTAGETVAGSPYAITQGTLAANGNYAISFTGNALTITPATLTIAAQAKTKTYGANDPALSFTASGLQFSDTQASVLTGALTRTAGETVAGNPYAITQGALAANGNYAISFTGNALTITPATLTIAAQAKTKTYGANDPALSFTVSGLQFSDTQASVLTGALTRAAGETVAGSPYAITQGTLAANGNYAISFTGANLLITPASLSVIADQKTKVYGAADPAFTVSYVGLVNNESATVLGGTLVVSRVPGENAGDYPITPSNLTASNYAIVFNSGTLSIVKAPLSVIADSASKNFGAPDPVFTVTYSGFVNNDSASGLGGLLSITRATGESPGNYVITPSGLTSTNYSIVFGTGILTITQPESLVLSLTRNGDAGVVLTWNAISNSTYRVQYKTRLDATNWNDLAGDVLANSISASKTDIVTSSNRFYRVRTLP